MTKCKGPTVRELLNILIEQDEIIAALVGLCEERNTLIAQLTASSVAEPAASPSELNGHVH